MGLLSKTVSGCIYEIENREELSEREIQQIEGKFAEADGDSDGCVTWAEVEAARAKNPALLDLLEMDDEEESFKMLDTDKSDCITLEELATLWKEKISEHETE